LLSPITHRLNKPKKTIMKTIPSRLLTLACLVSTALSAQAHDGRRFQVEVNDGQLSARGVNTIDSTGPDGTTVIDPKGLRPYTQAVHGHWTNATAAVFSTLPGYDAGSGADVLAGHDLTLTLTGARKWSGVGANLDGAQVRPGTTTDFGPLDAGESIELNFGGVSSQSVDTADLGVAGAGLSLTLIDGFDGRVALDDDGLAQRPAEGSNGYDLDLTYFYSGPSAPADTLYVIESVLSTTHPGVRTSETVYTLLSPDGMGPVQRLHFASLFAERALGTTVPEPAALALLCIGATALAMRRSAGRVG